MRDPAPKRILVYFGVKKITAHFSCIKHAHKLIHSRIIYRAAEIND